MDTADLLKKVRKIEIKSRGLTNHIFVGEYNSAFKGRGMLFSEVLEYAYGDDIKNIDWNVTARAKTPHVKIFEEERELTVMLLVDISASVFFGTAQRFKSELITEICAVLAFSAIANNDKVGVIFFDNEVRLFVPPRKGRSHVLRIIRELLTFSMPENVVTQGINIAKNQAAETVWWKRLLFFPDKKNTQNTKLINHNNAKATNISAALAYFSNVIKKRSIAFLLSDFLDYNYQKALNLAGRKHDITGLLIYDPREASLAPAGLLPATDPETQQTIWIDTNSQHQQQIYTSFFNKHLAQSRAIFSRCGIDLLTLRTNGDYVKQLMRYFKKRGG